MPFALGLGANQGDEARVLRRALAVLEDLLGRLDRSPFYGSRAVSPIPQPDYVNAAAVGSTTLPADAVLAVAKQVELDSGRVRGERYGPRILDVDLLLYGDLLVNRPELTLPHPRLGTRRFMLAPLADVAPGWPVPPSGRTVAELLAGVGQEDSVWRLPG